MANPKVIRECRNCGEQREHYTRSSGRVISPCVDCQIAKQKARQKDIRKDPYKLAVQREKWAKYKKLQRLAAEDAPPVAEAEIPPRPEPQVPAARRRRRPLPPPPKA